MRVLIALLVASLVLEVCASVGSLSPIDVVPVYQHQSSMPTTAVLLETAKGGFLEHIKEEIDDEPNTCLKNSPFQPRESFNDAKAACDKAVFGNSGSPSFTQAENVCTCQTKVTKQECVRVTVDAAPDKIDTLVVGDGLAGIVSWLGAGCTKGTCLLVADGGPNGIKEGLATTLQPWGLTQIVGADFQPEEFAPHVKFEQKSLGVGSFITVDDLTTAAECNFAKHQIQFHKADVSKVTHDPAGDASYVVKQMVGSKEVRSKRTILALGQGRNANVVREKNLKGELKVAHQQAKTVNGMLYVMSDMQFMQGGKRVLTEEQKQLKYLVLGGAWGALSIITFAIGAGVTPGNIYWAAPAAEFQGMSTFLGKSRYFEIFNNNWPVDLSCKPGVDKTKIVGCVHGHDYILDEDSVKEIVVEPTNVLLEEEERVLSFETDGDLLQARTSAILQSLRLNAETGKIICDKVKSTGGDAAPFEVDHVLTGFGQQSSVPDTVPGAGTFVDVLGGPGSNVPVGLQLEGAPVYVAGIASTTLCALRETVKCTGQLLRAIDDWLKDKPKYYFNSGAYVTWLSRVQELAKKVVQ